MTPIEEAKAVGYSDDEINAYLRPKVAEAMDVGYSQDEINKHLGVTPPPAFDGAGIQAHGEASHAAYGKPVTSFMDALEAGWQISTAGLQVRGAAPNKVLAENAPMASRMANNVAMMVGDLPAMAGGAVAGSVGGAEGGPPGMAIGGVAGAMALPTALRGLMMDAYEKKQFANFGDFWERVGPIMLDTAKSWVTGAATGATGAAVGPAAGALGRVAPALSPALSSPTVLAATKTAAEIGTLTTVGAAMEGHAPTAQEFLDAAVLLGGLHFATAGAAKLRSIYAEKGIPPSAVVQDAERDVTVKQDLLSDRGMPRLYEGSGSGTPQTAPLSGETIGKGDLWRLAPDQLNAMLGEKSESDHDKLVRALGSEEAAAEFNRLDRKQNSSDPQRADEGSREFDVKFGSLTPEQERLIYGSGETDAQTEDIKSVLDAHNARSPDDPNEAAYEAALAMRRTTPAEILQVPSGNAPASAQAAWVQLRNAYEDMANAGIPSDQVGNRIIGALIQRGWSPEDAKEVIGSFGEAMRQGTSRSAVTPVIARIAHETEISADGKTPDQFFDAITDKLSQDQVSALQARLEPEHDAAYQAAEQATQDWIAHHGTPHDFERFDTSKIGTGEGAQAYGHGLYFAENKGVAKGYQNTVTQMQASPELISARSELNKAIDASNKVFGDLIDRHESTVSPEAVRAMELYKAAVDAAMAKVDALETTKGHLYTVRIKAKPEEMLDWDKSLSAQPDMLAKLAPLLKEHLGYDESQAASLTGQEAHDQLASVLGPQQGRGSYHLDEMAVSDALHDAGVKGIRYLDRDSRTEGEGTRNVVVFNHDDVDITHKNGEAVTPHAPTADEAAVLAREQGQPRTLEDLENEYRQENATDQTQPGAATGAGAGSPAGSAGVVAQGGGPVGGAAGVAGRPGTQAATGGGGGGNTGGPNQPPTGVGGPGTTPEQRVLAHMSIGEAASTRPWTWARLYTDVVNKIFPIEQAVTRIAGKNVLVAADDPGKLARLLSGATGIADRFLRFDTLDFATRQPNGLGLETILAPWRDNLNGFRAYIASRHALDLESQGIKTGFDLNDAQSVVTSGGHFQAAADELTAFSNRMAAYLRDSGVISPAAYTEMVNTRAYYVPFQRVIDKIGQGGGGTGGTLQPANPIHGQVGSERMVIDPIESIVRNAYLFTQMAERNVTGTKLVDLLLSNGEAESTSVPPPPRTPMATLRALGVGMSPDEMEALVQASRPTMGAEVRIFRAGTPETYRVDPEIATAVKGLDSQNMGDLERMLRPFANSLRAGAVLQPDFVARHTIRDFLYAVVTHPGFFSPLDMVRGFTSLAVKDADYQDWRSSGGAGVSMVSLDRRYLQTSIDQMTDTGLLERAWNVIASPTSTPLQMAGAAARVPLDAARKFLISPMQMAVEFAESATHIGTFIKAKREMLAGQAPGTPLTREQIIEAGFASRDVAVDAARMGAKMRTLNALSAFSNIAVQDTDRVVRAFVNNPLSTALKIAGVISLPSALTWMNGQGDSRYDDAPDWEKDLFWVIPTDRWQNGPDDGRPRNLVRTVGDQTQVNNGITFRVPKPWGMGLIFGSGLERSLDSFVAAKPDAFKHFAASMGAVSVPSMIPNAITPMIEQYANRSIFTNRTLVPDKMTKELPEYQYTPYTTETSKALGSLMGAFPGLRGASISEGSFGGVARALSSPILMENYLRAWTGNLGMYALQAVDKGLRSAGMLPDPVKPDDTLADIPFVKAFIVRYPTASTQPIQDFSDEYKRNKVFFDTWQAQAKEGNMEAMRHIQDLGGPMMFVQLNGIHQALGEHAKIVRDIYKNPSIPSDEKRQLIDTTYWRMTELAKAGNTTLAAAKTALATQGAQ